MTVLSGAVRLIVLGVFVFMTARKNRVLRFILSTLCVALCEVQAVGVVSLTASAPTLQMPEIGGSRKATSPSKSLCVTGGGLFDVSEKSDVVVFYPRLLRYTQP